MEQSSLEAVKLAIQSFVGGLKSHTTRMRVLAFVSVQQAVFGIIRKSIYPDLQAGKDRLREYFRDYVGEVLDSDELAMVSGIKDYPRRIRELRVEEGWPILSGTGLADLIQDNRISGQLPDIDLPPAMRPDQYILVANTPDTGAAKRWELANTIRRRDVGTKEKLLAYFRANVNAQIGIEELRYVASDSGDWPRRTRELRTEDGWPIVTRYSGDPSMPPATYRLAEDRQSAPHDRHISETTRRAVMKRDEGRCQWRDCGWPIGFPASDHRFLEVHHIVHHLEGGENEADNLITLCNLHHDEVHRTNVLDLEPRNF